MNIRKASLGIFLLVFCLMGITPKADGFSVGQIIDGSLLTDEKEAFDMKELVPESPFDQEIIPFGTYLSNGTARITDQGNGVVDISGETYCYKVSDEVFVKLYLQKLSNGGWSTIKMHSNTAYNTYVAYAGVSFSVPKGHYYRVKGTHYAKKNGVTESTTTCTSGVYIN